MVFVIRWTRLALVNHGKKKLEILKDPHTGAFAIFGCIAYFLLAFGFWTQLSPAWPEIIVLGLSFCAFPLLEWLVRRDLSSSQKQRTAENLLRRGAKQTATIVCAILSAVCLGVMAVFSWPLSLACLVGSGLAFLYYRIMSYRQFGGITGDIAGIFFSSASFPCWAVSLFTQLILGGTYL